jgi:biotin carboxylase
VVNRRSRLAIIYDPASLTPWELIEIARPLADLIWVLEAGDPQLAELVPLLRRRGTVVDVDGQPDEAVVDLVEARRPDGVMAFAERQMPLAAAIAARCGLPFHSPQTAELLANKYRQRLALAAGGVPGPDFWAVPSDAGPAELATLAATLPYPVVLKPQAGMGSRGTAQVDDAAALLAALADTAGEHGPMLVEELLVESRPRAQQRLGETLMVDSAIARGRVDHYVVTGHFIPAPPFRGTGSFLPSTFGGGVDAAVLDATSAAIAALGVEHGFTNTDLILTPDGPRVLEVNGRIGGEIHRLLGLVGAPGLLPAAIQLAFDAPGVAIARPEPGRVAFCAYLQPPTTARRLLALRGLEQVEALPGVVSVVRHRHPGAAVDWRQGTGGRVLTVYGVAGDLEELASLHARMMGAIDAEYEPGAG